MPLTFWALFVTLFLRVYLTLKVVGRPYLVVLVSGSHARICPRLTIFVCGYVGLPFGFTVPAVRVLRTIGYTRLTFLHPVASKQD